MDPPSPEEGLYISILHTILEGFCVALGSPIHRPSPAPAPAVGLRWEAVTGPATVVQLSPGCGSRGAQ